MDKDRIAGAAEEIKGSVKEAIGKAVGDAKLQSDGKADKVEGKLQNAIGGLKDALKKLRTACASRHASTRVRATRRGGKHTMKKAMVLAGAAMIGVVVLSGG